MEPENQPENPPENPPESSPENPPENPPENNPEVPQWGKDLQNLVGGLVEKIDTLTGANTPPDESPSGKPWTHKKFW